MTDCSVPLREFVEGDASLASKIYPHAHDVLLSAASGEDLVVTTGAATRVLNDLAAGKITDPDAQRWASFVRRGYCAGQAGPIEDVPIRYDPRFEDVLVEAIARLDELGDIVDGELSSQEISDLLDQLRSGIPR